MRCVLMAPQSSSNMRLAARMLVLICLLTMSVLVPRSNRPAAVAQSRGATPTRTDDPTAQDGGLDVAAVDLADFSASPLQGPAPLTVQFEDLSTGSPTSWSWQFGDGGGSVLRNPQHVYTQPGVYSVSLSVITASGGVDRRTRIGYITVGPTTYFTYLPGLAR